MTRFACVAKGARNVVRVRRFGKIRGMAHEAICICKLVVAIDMTRLAWRRRVRTGQRKLRCAVIEGRWFPHCRRVACLAYVAESSRDVIWICWRRKVC
jgi:hypothetical protein